MDKICGYVSFRMCSKLRWMTNLTKYLMIAFKLTIKIMMSAGVPGELLSEQGKSLGKPLAPAKSLSKSPL